MNAAQLAHLLKMLGKGTELEGMAAIYRLGWMRGVRCALIAGAVVCIAYQLWKPDDRKAMDASM
ncbi:MAG: hypothetical protein IJ083_16970 [Clostridia bacterium]|nr:hypothetical protein [Clostridia bacterium]